MVQKERGIRTARADGYERTEAYAFPRGGSVSAAPKAGFYAKADLGIVKYHFGTGAERKCLGRR